MMGNIINEGSLLCLSVTGDYEARFIKTVSQLRSAQYLDLSKLNCYF